MCKVECVHCNKINNVVKLQTPFHAKNNRVAYTDKIIDKPLIFNQQSNIIKVGLTLSPPQPPYGGVDYSPFYNFSNTPYVAKVFEQAVGPGVLHTFSTCAVKH